MLKIGYLKDILNALDPMYEISNESDQLFHIIEPNIKLVIEKLFQHQVAHLKCSEQISTQSSWLRLTSYKGITNKAVQQKYSQ